MNIPTICTFDFYQVFMQQGIKLILPVMLINFFSAQAQLKKGNKIIGATIGSLFFNSGATDVSYPAPTAGYRFHTTSSGVNFKPSVGWFISDNTISVITININPSNQRTSYEINGNTYREDKTNSFSTGAGGFLRNYFKTSSSFVPFAQAGVNMGLTKIRTSGFLYTDTDKITYNGKSSGGFTAGGSMSLGVTKWIHSYIGLDFYAGYIFSYTKSTNKTTTLIDQGNNGSIDLTEIREPTTKFTNHGFELGAGIQIFLERKN